MNGLPETMRWCENNGFRIYPNSLHDRSNLCDWIACRRVVDVRECETNDYKVQVVIRPWYAVIGQHTINSCEIEITGEYGDQWYRLGAYSLPISELPARLPAIEKALTSAWQALSK